MRTFFFVAAIVAGGWAQAATVNYSLTDVLAFNAFAPEGASICTLITHSDGSAPVPCAGSAISDGNNVTASGIQFDFNNVSQDFIYTSDDWSTTVGAGVSLFKNGEICLQFIGNPCVDSLEGNWFSEIPTALHDVTVTETVGATLSIRRTEPFAGFPGMTSGFIFEFAVVPAPAAVWLFGSTLVVLAGVKRSRYRR